MVVNNPTKLLKFYYSIKEKRKLGDWKTIGDPLYYFYKDGRVGYTVLDRGLNNIDSIKFLEEIEKKSNFLKWCLDED